MLQANSGVFIRYHAIQAQGIRFCEESGIWQLRGVFTIVINLSN